jgi:hypothetical protein
MKNYPLTNFENDPMVESTTPHRAGSDVNGLKLTSQPSSKKRIANAKLEKLADEMIKCSVNC